MMGCEGCAYRGMGYGYRWKDANIVIIACEKHAREIMDILNDVEDLEEELRKQKERG